MIAQLRAIKDDDTAACAFRYNKELLAFANKVNTIWMGEKDGMHLHEFKPALQNHWRYQVYSASCQWRQAWGMLCELDSKVIIMDKIKEMILLSEDSEWN